MIPSSKYKPSQGKNTFSSFTAVPSTWTTALETGVLSKYLLNEWISTRMNIEYYPQCTNQKCDVHNNVFRSLHLHKNGRWYKQVVSLSWDEIWISGAQGNQKTEDSILLKTPLLSTSALCGRNGASGNQDVLLPSCKRRALTVSFCFFSPLCCVFLQLFFIIRKNTIDILGSFCSLPSATKILTRGWDGHTFKLAACRVRFFNLKNSNSLSIPF